MAEMAPQGGESPLLSLLVQTDEALTKLSQVIGRMSPEAGEALGALNEQFREITKAALSQQGPSRAPSQMVSPETQGRKASPAY